MIRGYILALIGQSVGRTGAPIAQTLVRLHLRFLPRRDDSIYRLRLNVTWYKYTNVHSLMLNVALTGEESRYRSLQTKIKIWSNLRFIDIFFPAV